MKFCPCLTSQIKIIDMLIFTLIYFILIFLKSKFRHGQIIKFEISIIIRPNMNIRNFIFDSREIYELRIFFTSMWVKYKQGYVFKSNDPIHIPLGITF